MRTRPTTLISHPEGMEFYRSGILRKWRWRITASNGLIIGQSSQGYRHKSDAEYNALSVAKSINESDTLDRWMNENKL